MIGPARDGAVATTSGELPTEPFTVTADRSVGLAARNWSAQKRESGIHSVLAGETLSDCTAALGLSSSTVTVMHVPLTVGRLATQSSAMAWVAAWTSGAVMTLSGTPFWHVAELTAAAGVPEVWPVRSTTTITDAAAITTATAAARAMRRPLCGDERARRRLRLAI